MENEYRVVIIEKVINYFREGDKLKFIFMIINNEDKDHIKNNKGRVLGRAILDQLKVLTHRYGNEVTENMEMEMKNAGYEIDLKNLKPSDKVPISYYMAFFVIEKQMFKLDDEGMREMGREVAKLSFFVKFASKYLISLEILCNNAQVGWDKYYQKEGGILKITELNKDKKFFTGEIYDFWGHPAHSRYVEGYFEKIVSFVTGCKTICREEKSPFDKKGDPHFFVVRWS